MRPKTSNRARVASLVLVATGVVLGCWLALMRGSGDEQRPRLQGVHASRIDEIQREAELPALPVGTDAQVSRILMQQTHAPTAGTLEVRVVAGGPDGAPVEGATVSLYEEAGGGWSMRAWTNADGLAFFECPKSECSVWARPTSDTEGYGGARAIAVKLSSELTRVELVLPPTTSRLSVRVVDNQFTPVPGVVLKGSGPMGSLRDGDRATGADGVATWPDVIAGRWRVSVKDVPEDFADLLRSRLDVVLPADAGLFETMTITRLGLLRVDIAQARASQGLHQLSVAPGEGPDGSWRQLPWDSGVEPWRLPPGQYEISAVWGPDSESYSPSISVQIAPGQTTEVSLPVLSAENVCAGQLLDGQGTAVAGVTVSVSSMREDLPSLGSPEARAPSRKSRSTGPDGRWIIRGGPTGRAWLSINVDAAKGRHWAFLKPQEFQIPTGELTFTLRPGYRLHCTLQDGPAREAFIEADENLRVVDKFSAREHLDRWRGEQTAEGVYDFDHVPAGTYVAMIVHRDGTLSKGVEFELPAWDEEGAQTVVLLDFDEADDDPR